MSHTVPKPIKGYYRYTDVIEQISATYKLDESKSFKLIEEMARDILTGKLVTRNTETGLPIQTPDSPSVYVTALDVRKWLVDKGLPYSWQPNKPQRVQSVTIQRQMLILEKIVELRYNPQKLPKQEAGHAGVKKLVRNSLGTQGIWAGTTVFDKAWEMLRRDGQIAEV